MIIEFINGYIRDEKISILEYSKRVGLSHTKVYKILSNKQRLGNKSIRAVAKLHNIDIRKVVDMCGYK